MLEKFEGQNVVRVIVKEKKETGISLAGFSVAFGSTGCSGSAGPGACPPPGNL